MRTLYLLVCVAVACSGGCVMHLSFTGVEGSGVVVTQQREVGDFEGIVLHGSGELSVRVGQPASVTVEIDDNLLELIRTEVYEGRLVIKNRENYRSQQGLRMLITVPNLNYLNIAGAGDVQIDDLKSDEFQVYLNGSGDLFGHGSAERLSVEINGSGNIDFSDIVATDASVNINGSGDVRVHAVQHLAASIHGSGDIRYRGSPEVNRSVLGSGDIKQLPE